MMQSDGKYYSTIPCETSVILNPKLIRTSFLRSNSVMTSFSVSCRSSIWKLTIDLYEYVNIIVGGCVSQEYY